MWQILPFWLAFTIGLRWVWVYVATNIWCLSCPFALTARQFVPWCLGARWCSAGFKTSRFQKRGYHRIFAKLCAGKVQLIPQRLALKTKRTVLLQKSSNSWKSHSLNLICSVSVFEAHTPVFSPHQVHLIAAHLLNYNLPSRLQGRNGAWLDLRNHCSWLQPFNYTSPNNHKLSFRLVTALSRPYEIFAPNLYPLSATSISEQWQLRRIPRSVAPFIYLCVFHTMTFGQ